MQLIYDSASAINLLTLSGLEIVLGIDNVIFIALIVQHLPHKTRNSIRLLGLILALVLRIIMLFGVSWIIGLTYPLYSLYGFVLTGKSLMLIGGGGFLIVKSCLEIKEMFAQHLHKLNTTQKDIRYFKAITQIVFIDLVLSFDSIITAVGMAGNNLPIIIMAIFIAMFFMLVASKPIGEFITEYQSIKVIALAFIFLVGIFLVMGGIGIEIPKAYLYFAMFFCMSVETINILLKKYQSKHPEH